MSFESQSATFY